MANEDNVTKEQLAKAIFSYCTGCWGGNQPHRVASCDNIYCKLHTHRLLACPEIPDTKLIITNNEPKKKKISEEDQKILTNKKKAITKK